MKKLLLSLSLLLGIAGSTQAQSPCAVSVTKSGTGLTRTYTASSATPNASFWLLAYPMGGSNYYNNNYGTSLTNTLTVTYPSSGIYEVNAQGHAPSCSDSMVFLDTVVAPPSPCAVTLTKSGTGANRTYTVSSAASGPVGYTVFSYATSGSGGGSYNSLTSATGASFNVTYGTSNVYIVTAKTATANCADSVQILDTVVVPVIVNPCALTLTKSGTGLTRTYTVSSAAANPNYTISVFSSIPGGTGSSNTNSLTMNYTYGGYYYVVAQVTGGGNCYDSVMRIDTVVGAMNCPTNFTLNATQGGASSFYNGPVNHYGFSMLGDPGAGPGYTRTLVLDYGDGRFSTDTPYTHTYVLPQSNTKVKATITYNHPTFGSCILKDSVNINVPTCAGISSTIVANPVGGSGSYTFNNVIAGAPGAGYTGHTRWYLQNALTGLYQQVAGGGNLFGYTFTNNGAYTIRATTTYHNPGVSNSLCVTTNTAVVNVTNVTSNLNIYVYVDTALGFPAYNPQVKTWLIKKDNVTGTLTAIDSVTGPMNTRCNCYVNVAFNNLAAGVYRTKSHILNQPAGSASGYIPTYNFSAAYWSAADTFISTGVNNISGSTKMLSGTPTSGPGFIGGLISAGANKGTAVGDPVAGINVLLRNVQGKLIKMATTDAAGKYSFSNLAVGIYNVYPEELAFNTIASDPIIIADAQSTAGKSYNFKRNANDKEYVPGISTAAVGTIGKIAFSIAPNPATDKIQINLGQSAGKTIATLSNTTGQVVMQKVITGNTTELSVSQLPAGIYMLQLQNGNDIHTEKVQIQH